MVTYQKKSLAVFVSIALASSSLAAAASSSSSTNSKANEILQDDLKNLYNPTTFHQSNFGGKFNPSHPSGNKLRRQLSEEEISIPKSAVKHAIPSLGRPNIENLFGHYVHDEFHSPFSSYLYNRPKEELKEEQEEYEAKMEQVRKEWGAWDFKDDTMDRPIANFDSTPYKDMDNGDFPDKSWQMDKKYVTDFIEEGEKLINRMIEGIYAEYGHPTKKTDGSTLSEEEITTRNEWFKIHINDSGNRNEPGFGYMNQAGMDALSKKLLHGMMTNDEFYFVLGGHSAAAGHGNNFLQQKTMQFHYIMEPVFQKLGMRLISRNLAMGGLGTLHFTMGEAELYGEKDFIQWDSAMTEKNHGDIDNFNKQALMNGERVPIIFTQFINNLETETGGNIWHGDVSTSKDFLPITTGLEQALTLPLAARYQLCEASVQELCGDRNNPNKYDAYCWFERKDFAPTRGQNRNFPSQASWHPGNRYHQYESRKTAMAILQGFQGAFKLWKSGIEKDGFPLKESYWHIGSTYETVQSTLKSYINGEGKGKSECEKHFEQFGLDRVCRTTMHGMSEFLPVNLGVENSIHANMKAASNGWVPKPEAVETYSGVDLLPISWKIPATEVDLHAIAIVSTRTKPTVDDNWYDVEIENVNPTDDDYDYDDDDVEDPEDSRRLRRKETRQIKANEATRSSLRRNLGSDEVVPGLGWGIEANSGSEVTGYCDGSSNSFNCHRSQASSCLLSGHNDSRNTISGDGLSGWLVIQIPKLKDGLIFGRLEWWHPRDSWYLTKDWTEVNNGNRALGKVVPWPDDVEIDIALNGKIIATWNWEYFESINVAMAYNEAFYKFYDDENFTSGEGEPVEFGLRIRSESNPKRAGLAVSHIYYA